MARTRATDRSNPDRQSAEAQHPVIGRDNEVREVVETLAQHRLVMLTGPGAIGKTRLATAVVETLIGEFPYGVWMVELASTVDPRGCGGGGRRVGGDTAATVHDDRADHAGVVGRSLLLVLDNCEHVLEAATDVVDAALSGATTVSVLATLCEPLRHSAERRWIVPPLGSEVRRNQRSSTLWTAPRPSTRASISGATTGSDSTAVES